MKNFLFITFLVTSYLNVNGQEKNQNLNPIEIAENKLREIILKQNKSLRDETNLRFIYISIFDHKILSNDSLSWSQFNVDHVQPALLSVSFGFFHRKQSVLNSYVLVFSGTNYIGEYRPSKKWKKDNKLNLFSNDQAKFLNDFGALRYFIRKGGSAGQLQQLFCKSENETLILCAKDLKNYDVMNLKSYIKFHWTQFKKSLSHDISIG